jgi:hypothetical protein
MNFMDRFEPIKNYWLEIQYLNPLLSYHAKF